MADSKKDVLKSPHGDLEADKELMRRAFIRKARQAVHQVLVYVGLGYKTVNLRLFAKVLPFVEKWKNDTNSDIRRSSEEMRQRIRALVCSVAWDEAIDDDPIVLAWKSLRDRLTADFEFPREDDDLRRACESFLNDAELSTGYFDHILPDLLHWLRKMAAFVLALATISYVFWKVEQVRALFSNAGFLGTAVPALFLLSPFILSWIIANRTSRRGVVYFWDFGGVPFRSFHFQARAPERGFPFYAREGRLPVRLLWRILTNVLFFVVVLGAVVAAAALHWALTDSTHIYTAVLAMGIFYVFLSLAMLVDFWDFFSQLPIRASFLALGIAIYIVLNFESGYWLALVLFGGFLIKQIFALRRATPASFVYHAAFGIFFVVLTLFSIFGLVTQRGKEWRNNGGSVERLRSNEWPWKADGVEGGPVVVMAASGGGSRAAVYTALTLEALHNARLDIACSVQAISSVSGGSLANAAYVARRFGASENCEALGERKPDWLVGGVTGDFILSTMRGLVNGKGRGRQIEETWRAEPTGLGSTKLSDLVTKWRGTSSGEHPPFPLPIFNTSTLDTFDVVISPLERDAYSPRALIKSAQGKENRYETIPERFAGLPPRRLEAQPTWVYYRDGIYGLEDLLPGFDADLAESVRASANFPFGFPLVRVRTKEPLYLSLSFNIISPPGTVGRLALRGMTDIGVVAPGSLQGSRHECVHPLDRVNVNGSSQVTFGRRKPCYAASRHS